ncbi:RNA 2'-phosphotransferase [Winogradskyella luteola]|uniref:Probable RNA 2'-phosphotransferase n=1 Tax=Winogradskyella luteola TaxID=2828330 RepID=A0A9X1FB04_9FLAO|nr:RNA 2'-phosphotransferase [Winogradskyella luteola]MBV7270724.1 RNA 2'-phosphotransferase [Winogradskyella luteola]
MDFNKLSKVISHALRHQPSLYDLELSKDGWVEISLLIKSIQKVDSSFSTLSVSDVKKMISTSKKKRHELKGNKIRATYGHSIQDKIIIKPFKPPKYLYHATKQKSLPSIFEKGLLPMKRQYVHLSENKSDSMTVGLRRTNEPILLKVKSEEAFIDGVDFYPVENGIWLCDKITVKYLEIISS